ncbi:MAG: transposase [Flavobacteriales bacterium]|nr:transposase [Flavobacteriales bacterium]
MRTIGIDVSKATLDAALQDEQGNVVKEERVKNSTSGLRTLLRKWTRQGLCDTRALVCLEPTGHYSHGVVKTLVVMRYPTWLAHATDIRLSIGMQRGKSDTVDAPRIAQYAHRFRDKARLVGQAHLAFAELKALLALRERLVKERAKDKAQLSDNVLHLTGSAKELMKAELQRQAQGPGAVDRPSSTRPSPPSCGRTVPCSARTSWPKVYRASGRCWSAN